MRIYFYLIILLTVIVTGCSLENPKELEEPLQTFSSKADFKATIKSEKFQEFVKEKFRVLNKGKENNNGVIVVSRGFNQFFGFFTPDYTIGIYDFDEQFLLKIFSEDRAQFFIRSNEPTVEVLDRDFNLLYSNLCQERKTGHLQVSLISDYDFFDFGPFQVYFFKPPFDSANILKANSNVYDGVEIDYETGEVSCTEPTTIRKLNITSLFRDNSANGNPPLINITLK